MKKWLLVLLLAIPFQLAQAQTCTAGATCKGSVTASGTTCATTGACVALQFPYGAGSASITIGGTYSATLQFEVSGDGGQTWTSIAVYPPGTPSSPVTTTTGTGNWQANVGGFTNIRVRGSSYTSGTATVTIQTSPAAAANFGSAGSGSCANCATSSSGGRYSLTLQIGSTAASSPVSATTYYLGQGAALQTVSTAVTPTAAALACTIASVSYSLYVSGTKDSAADNITFKVYDLTTSTAFADTAGTLTAQTTTQHSTVVTGAADTVSAGDQLAVQVVTPTFATAPVNVYFQTVIACQP